MTPACHILPPLSWLASAQGFPYPVFVPECEYSCVGLKFKSKLLVVLDSLSMHVHVACACVTVYWASPLILSFQVLIVLLMTTTMMTLRTVTIAWVTGLISRSVLMSTTLSCGLLFLYVMFERLTYSIYGFY